MAASATVLIAYPLAACRWPAATARRCWHGFRAPADERRGPYVRVVAILRPGGVLDGIANALGLPPPDGALYQNDFAVIGMVHPMTPFAALPLYAGFLRLDPELRPAAASLGAGRAGQWRRIVLPLTLPTALASGVLVFVTTLGFVITPQILGGPGGVMLGVLISRRPRTTRLLAALLSATLLLTTVAILAALRLVAERFRARGLI